jgi:hypothetical protein
MRAHRRSDGAENTAEEDGMPAGVAPASATDRFDPGDAHVAGTDDVEVKSSVISFRPPAACDDRAPIASNPKNFVS